MFLTQMQVSESIKHDTYDSRESKQGKRDEGKKQRDIDPTKLMVKLVKQISGQYDLMHICRLNLSNQKLLSINGLF